MKKRKPAKKKLSIKVILIPSMLLFLGLIFIWSNWVFKP